MITVLVADCHDQFRQQVVAILESAGDFRIVAEANTSSAALESNQINNPQLIIIDPNFLENKGSALIKSLRKQNSEAKIIVLSLYNNRRLMAENLAAGADCFLQKEYVNEELLGVLSAVSAGKTNLFAPWHPPKKS